MDLIYKYPGKEYSINSILEFQRDEQSAFWSEPLFHFFPNIDRELFKSFNYSQRVNYLNEFFNKFSMENEPHINEKIIKYNEIWKLYKSQIVDALEEAFEINLDNVFNNMVVYISFNPISPRYLDNDSFDVFFLNSERGALGISLHEIIHFVWFYIWNNHFNDNYEEYETPNLKWILSEMVVDSIMRDDRLKSINPYFNDGGCVYSYFYTLKIDDEPILDILYDMYKKMPITDFMEKSYELCLIHELKIRKHIDENE